MRKINKEMRIINAAENGQIKNKGKINAAE